MIRSLRDEIDHRGFLNDEKLKKNSQKTEMEFKHLKDTIIELRSKLDKHHVN